MKKTKQITAILLATLIIIAAGISAYAVTEEPSSPKEEVVYAKLDGGGDVTGIYVVNIFSGGEIIDYGNYTEVKTLNTNDEINRQNDKISIHSAEDKVYYEGTLDSHNLPWDIAIGYKLNGENITARELAGKSGALEINIGFKENPNCDGSFFHSYALQTTMALDTEKCENISAAGATIANVGQKKQLTYITLPGREQNITVTANVKDFSMDAVNINGIRMDITVDIDNNELMSKVRDIENAAVAMDDGASAVADGAKQINDGTQTLNDNAYTIAAGGANLAAGVDNLCRGLDLAQNGLNQLNEHSDQLTAGSGKIYQTLQTINNSLAELSVSAETVKSLIDASSTINQNLKLLSSSLNGLEQGISTDAMSQSGINLAAAENANHNAVAVINEDITAINGMMSDLKSLEAQIRAAGYGDTYDAYMGEMAGILRDLNTLKTTANNSVGALQGTEQYINGVHQKTEVLKENAAVLSAKYDEFNSEITKLASILTSMLDNMNQLKQAITTLCTAYGNFDGNLNAYTDGVASLVAGFDQSAASVAMLSTGSKDLAIYLNALATGSNTLADYTAVLADGSATLAQGTAAFRNATRGMDQQVQSEIDRMMDSLTGGSSPTRSFVSDKNTNVTAVQFVISTDPIQTQEESN